MLKRKAQERINRYNEKIRRLEQKQQRTRIRVIQSSSEESEVEEEAAVDVADTILEIEKDATVADSNPTEPELDPEILVALGESTEEDPTFGPPIHDKLAKIWTPILKKGLPRELKEKLLKDCLIPGNCTLLKAPTLNVELTSNAVSEMSKNRDKKLEATQQQLGLGISMMNQAMSLLLEDKDKIKSIKLLSDACRILTDLHFVDTQVRIKLLTPGLDKAFLNIIKDSERDETLFGQSLSQKIRTSKVIEKQGLQIKKILPAPKPVSPIVIPRIPRYQENWYGPPRFPSNRGGRGGYRRPPIRRPLAPLPPPLSAPQQKPVTQYKARASQQQ